MARAPLLQLSGVSLTFGGNPLFDSLDLTVQSGDRLALVGRNGSGKSTLMKLMAGQVAADAGSRAVPPGTTVGYMEQDPDFSGYATLGDFAAAGLPEAERFRVAVVAEGLGFDPAVATGAASGGERRRAALARLLAAEPELMLLDEPTNHLDIQAITWLEDLLAESRAAHVVISHDRAFLRRVTRGTLWLDRGTLRRNDRGFEAFEDWRDTVWDEEDLARHKLERKIKAEARWAVEGISARRRRNMGRVRALNAMRAERAAMIRRQGTADLALDAGQTSGRLVIEASGISKAYGDRLILRPLDLTVLRGDRVAIVGPNGSGKTTLLRLLTGELAPDSGRIRQGTNLEIAVFDQSRAALDLPMSLWDGLVNDPGMAVSGRSDQVMVRGAPRHVVAYLKDFLFDDAQARAPIGSLSGGEKARLLLARIMARPSNLLILDEPTNDLDVETLDLLQDVLGEYDGTVLLVSHDRDFIDRIATTTVILDGSGRATVYAGGWSDMQAQRAGEAPAGPARGPARPATGRPPAEKASAEKPPAEKPPATKPRRATGLTFTERHRLDSLPAVIGKLEAEIAKLSELLADPDLYARAPDRFARASEGLAARQAALGAAEDEWLELAARDEG